MKIKPILTEITITKGEKTNLIEISDNEKHYMWLTLTTKDITTLHSLTLQLRKGEIRRFEKE